MGVNRQGQNFLRILREGRSFSGRERHCLFVNSGNGKFFDASAVAGFDFDDDGRGLALVDWDGDGDLDVWMTNRNGPQVRFLQNQSQNIGHYIQLLLEGTESNRDAIGSRILVYLEGDQRPILRTLNAGDSFLSQSSKRVHIGLGDCKSIERLEIRWPNRKTQSFEVGDVDCSYIITEGQPTMIKKAEAYVGQLAETQLTLPQSTPEKHAMCFSLTRLPASTYESFDGSRQPFVHESSRLVLINLWASWCNPCLRELAEFTEFGQQLSDQGIDVIALNIEEESEDNNPANVLKKLKFPFRSGKADKSLLTRFQLLVDTLFELHEPLPLPTSFLLARESRVVAIYKGPVTVQKILDDSRKLKPGMTVKAWRRASLPFSGRWTMPPKQRDLFEFVEELARLGFIDECRIYVRDNPEMFQTHPGWKRLERLIGSPTLN